MKNLKKIVCAGVLATTALGLTSCKVVDEVKSWFDKDPVETTEDLPTAIVDGVAMNGGVVHGIPKNIAFTRATSNAVSISATVNEDASDPTLSWSLEWASSNGSEQVANYVSFTTSNEGKTCNLEVKKPFSVPINLKVSTVDGSSDTCKLDFLKALTQFNYKTIGGADGNNANQSFTIPYGNDNYTTTADSSISDSITVLYGPESFLKNKYGITADEFEFSFTYQETGTVGSWEVIDGYVNVSLTSEAKELLTSNGLSSYIQDYSLDSSGETSFWSTSIIGLKNVAYSSGYDANVKKVFDLLNSIDGDFVQYSFTYQTTYSGQTRTQNVTITSRAQLLNYIPATVSIDSNVVLK